VDPGSASIRPQDDFYRLRRLRTRSPRRSGSGISTNNDTCTTSVKHSLYSSHWESLKRNLQCGLRTNLLRFLPDFLQPDCRQWKALEIYEDQTRQVFSAAADSFEVPPTAWQSQRSAATAEWPELRGGARRERLDSSHHYGHDVLLKRHAGMPLIGRPLPLMLEHGLKCSASAVFEPPRPWMRGFVCMGPHRSEQLRQRYRLATIEIGPWICYSRPLMTPTDLNKLRAKLGPTLLVVPSHSWEAVERRTSQAACIDAVERIAKSCNYQTVIWLRYWVDAPIKAPPSWIMACNGHRSNPWFLDSMRTLLELSDGMASNAFGTHLGYGVALGKPLHWIDVATNQDLSKLTKKQARLEEQEWQTRQHLIEQLCACSDPQRGASATELWELLQPYWGLGQQLDPGELAARLTNPT